MMDSAFKCESVGRETKSRKEREKERKKKSDALFFQ
jgi:hypothetical protein